GELVALVGHLGIFEADIDARAREKHYCAGSVAEPPDPAEKIALRDEIIATEALRMVVMKLNESDVAGEVADLKHQFGDDRQFRAALRRSCVLQLRRLMAETIGGGRWIETRIASQIAVSDTEVQKYFEAQQAEIVQPLRIR